MKFLKPLLYGSLLSLLASCSLFSETPAKVVEGQRGIYQGLLVVEDNISTILQTYEEDCKAAVTYHVTFVYEEKIDAIRNSNLTAEEKTSQVATLESERDSEIRDAFTKIESRKQKMSIAALQNTFATKKLVEAVYNYLSTTPIIIDNVDFWIVKIAKASHGRDQN